MTAETPADVPPPPHPHRRREPLPWQQPKPAEEDPDARRAVEAIRACASYRLAEQDVDYLTGEDLRGLRLQLEYQRADTILREHGIDRTIVVFGSTRRVIITMSPASSVAWSARPARTAESLGSRS